MNPRISIIVEWDNAHLSSTRALQERSLARLASELASIPDTFEVTVLFDRRDADDVTALTARHFNRLQPALVSLDGHRYYEMKNAGFALARGELIVLWDSDIEPVPGALGALVDAFADPARMVVAGAAFIDPSTFLGRTWSVLSVFPPRPAGDAIERVSSFFANLVAFRREIIERYRFSGDDRMRMQCVDLSLRLTGDGIAIWQARAAKVKHPPPEGLRGLVQRAIWHAHDMASTRGGTRALGSVLAAALRRVRKLVRHRRDLGIPRHESPLIAIIIVAFGFLELLFLPFAVSQSRVPRWAL